MEALRQKTIDMMNYVPEDRLPEVYNFVFTIYRDVDPFMDDNSSWDECIAAFDKEFADGVPAMRDDPFYSPENQERLRRSMEQIEKTGGTVHEVDLND